MFASVPAFIRGCLKRASKSPDGKLQGTRTIVGQLRAPITDDLDEVLPIEYRVETSARSRGESLNAYRVGVPHITGPQEQLLVTKIVQINGTPMARAFDIDLRCLTAIARTCTDFSELAPAPCPG